MKYAGWLIPLALIVIIGLTQLQPLSQASSSLLVQKAEADNAARLAQAHIVQATLDAEATRTERAYRQAVADATANAQATTLARAATATQQALNVAAQQLALEQQRAVATGTAQAAQSAATATAQAQATADARSLLDWQQHQATTELQEAAARQRIQSEMEWDKRRVELVNWALPSALLFALYVALLAGLLVAYRIGIAAAHRREVIITSYGYIDLRRVSGFRPFALPSPHSAPEPPEPPPLADVIESEVMPEAVEPAVMPALIRPQPPERAQVLKLLRASMDLHGGQSAYIASHRALGWSGEDWDATVRLLDSLVEVKRGRPAKGALSNTRVGGGYHSLEELYLAVALGKAALDRPTPAPVPQAA